MAETKKSTVKLERTYNIPLRKEYLKVANWKRTKKAVKAAKEFLARHMKAADIKDVKLSKEVNEKIWQHGIKNPPHHIKVNVSKDDKGVVRAELFGAVEKEAKAAKKSKAEKPETTAKIEEKLEAAEVKT